MCASSAARRKRNDFAIAAPQHISGSPERVGPFEREARRRRDGREYAGTRCGGLVHQFETAAAGHDDESRRFGRLPARARAPISLSSALWRPTSSRTSSIAPSVPHHAAACTEWVDAIQRLQRRQRIERGAYRDAGYRRALAAADGADRGATAARPALRCRTGRSRRALRASGDSRASRSRACGGSAQIDSDAVEIVRHRYLLDRARRRCSDAFGQRQSDREILEVRRSRHHHGPGAAVDADFDRRFDGDSPGRNAPVARTGRAFARSAAARSWSAIASSVRWSGALRRRSPCTRGSWSPSRNFPWSPRLRRYQDDGMSCTRRLR